MPMKGFCLQANIIAVDFQKPAVDYTPTHRYLDRSWGEALRVERKRLAADVVARFFCRCVKNSEVKTNHINQWTVNFNSVLAVI